MFATVMLSQFHQLIGLSCWNQRVFILHSHQQGGTNLLALGMESEWVCHQSSESVLKELNSYVNKHNDWNFGFLSYDVKNTFENLTTRHHNKTKFPLVHFVVPQVVLRLSANEFAIEKNTSELSNDQITQLIRETSPHAAKEAKPISLQPVMTQQEYLRAVNHLHGHIQRGDIYEVNFCQEFFANEKIEHPFTSWLKLNSYTEAPFAAYVQTDNRYIMCASPERFIQKTGNKIISQPIKGTIARGKNTVEDEAQKSALANSEKEKSENVMIVDLVRNDLSRLATTGSVKVDELFGIYTFKTVHHMISTISAELRNEITFEEILRALFPMGSMTGAPKVRAMQLIDLYEYSARGIYSGTIGYITPQGDFDFNVVIRSIVCNNDLPYTSYSAGSAITALSIPEKEYEECLLKAEAMMKTLA